MNTVDVDREAKSRDQKVRELEAKVKELTERFNDIDIALFDQSLERKVEGMAMHFDRVDKRVGRHEALLTQIRLKQELLEDTFRRIVNSGGEVNPDLDNLNS